MFSEKELTAKEKAAMDPETAVTGPATPYAAKKPKDAYATHALEEEEYKSPYVTNEGKAANHAEQSPYISEKRDQLSAEEPFKSPYTTPENA